MLKWNTNIINNVAIVSSIAFFIAVAADAPARKPRERRLNCCVVAIALSITQVIRIMIVAVMIIIASIASFIVVSIRISTVSGATRANGLRHTTAGEDGAAHRV